MNRITVIVIQTVIIFALLLFILLKIVQPTPRTESRPDETTEAETYIFVSMLWNQPVFQQAKYGGQRAEKFWNENGADITVKFYGPVDGDLKSMNEALHRAVEENPTGIIYYDFESGGTDILTDYYEAGGLVSSWVGVDPEDKWPVHHIGGIDNIKFGEEMAEWAIEKKGTEFSVGIMTTTDNLQHQQRVQGILQVLARYDSIKIIEPYIEETYTPEGAVTNAILFLDKNPDVDVVLCTAALSAGAMGRACKISGLLPGEKLIIGSDQNPDLLTLMQEGYIHGALGYSFAADIFSSISWMHIYNNEAVSYTLEDREEKIWALPKRSVIPTIRFTKANAELMLNIPKPE